jgi:D-3-phosphoglycerate dehydrogenase
MPVVVLTDAERFPFNEHERAMLSAASVRLREVPGHDLETVLAAAVQADAIFVYHAQFSRATLSRLNGVQLLARCGAGYDNIDVAAARERGIEVTYVPDYGLDDIADHALGLLLACARRLVAGDRAIREGSWPSYAQLGPMFRVPGRTLGIFGYGRVGRNVAQKARAHGLRVLAYDPYVGDAADSRETVLREADFLSLHLPLTPETRHSIGRNEFAMMKHGAILINTARAGIVETSALVEALRSRQLASAGIDVFDETPLPPNDPMLALDNVVLTPHAAAFSEEALAELRTRSIEDVLRVLRGEKPSNPVP